MEQSNAMPDVKTLAIEAIQSLPDNSTWDDVMYRMYVRQKIEAGLADVDAGRTMDSTELRKELGLRS